MPVILPNPWKGELSPLRICSARIKRLASAWTGIGQGRCFCCGKPCFADPLWHDPPGLCPACARLLAPRADMVCPGCGLPMAGARGGRFCHACQAQPPRWSALAFYGYYRGLLRELLLRFKFGSDLYLAKLFAAFLLESCLGLPKPDCIVPIPQTARRLGRRGYNQAFEIARAFCALSGLPMQAELLKRVKEGSPQESLGALERRQNLAGAFRAAAQAAAKTIWLVDDVVTTGSTCAEAADELLRAGAHKVCLLFIARTPID